MFGLSKRDYYIYLFLNLIKQKGPISRTQLQEITELRPSTITDVVRELIENKLVKKEGLTNNGKGRSQVLLTINSDYLCVLCVTIYVKKISIAMSTIEGKILSETEKDITSFSNLDHILDLIITVCKNFINQYSTKKILGVGVADPGIVDIKGEYSVFSTQLSLWRDIPLKSILEKSLELPVKVEEGSRLMALGEKNYGLAQGITDFFLVNLSHGGIGISIVSNDTVVKGYNGTAGELGHTHVIDNGKICMCGSYGCLETVASQASIVSQVKEAMATGAFSYIREFNSDLDNICFEDIVKAITKNDKICLNIVEKAGIYIGITLSNLVNVLNPKLIIFDGCMCELGEAILNPIKTTIVRNSLNLAVENLEFKLSELKESSSSLGAVTMIMDDFFKSELMKRIYPT